MTTKKYILLAVDVVDNLTSTLEDVPLSANQGRILDIGKAPTSHSSTATTYGVSTGTNYGHAKASSTTPAKNGTAAVGSETGSFARGDHVHPTQILYGTTEPTASMGSIGDIHIQIE